MGDGSDNLQEAPSACRGASQQLKEGGRGPEGGVGLALEDLASCGKDFRFYSERYLF